MDVNERGLTDLTVTHLPRPMSMFTMNLDPALMPPSSPTPLGGIITSSLMPPSTDRCLDRALQALFSPLARLRKLSLPSQQLTTTTMSTFSALTRRRTPRLNVSRLSVLLPTTRRRPRSPRPSPRFVRFQHSRSPSRLHVESGVRRCHVYTTFHWNAILTLFA